MTEMSLRSVAESLVESGKGILAADESTPTIKKRFDTISLESTFENRRNYRELLFTSPGIEKNISGVIMFDETIRQSTIENVPFTQVLLEKGIITGIKVDQGTEPALGSEVEKRTKGLEGLAERISEYYNLGAKFAKWRAVFTISDNLPSEECMEINANDLAEYARICQANNLVPIVEPEVLMDGGHSIEQCYHVTRQVLDKVFSALEQKEVDLRGVVLKPNMVISGKDCKEKADSKKIAEMTIDCLKKTVPSEVPGIVFLSGGQTEQEACENLNMINKLSKDCPWKLSFSFGRALQNSTLISWSGLEENKKTAQQAFIRRVKLAGAASMGRYNSKMELID